MSEILPREYPCGFCGAQFGSYKYICTGPITNICNDCVDICVGYIADAEREKAERAMTQNPHTHEGGGDP